MLERNPLTQFEILGKLNSCFKRDTISIEDYEMLKKLTKLSNEGSTISYWVDSMWFVTRSQATLDKVNNYFGTNFKFNVNLSCEIQK